jgi:hypothetical protein
VDESTDEQQDADTDDAALRVSQFKVAFTTTGGLTSFITPSNARNATAKVVRMRPVQSLLFEAGGV